jgi:mRNA degradation ribonuclease J1/J2
MDLQETIRIELRRFFNANVGKKPVVLPIILDL